MPAPGTDAPLLGTALRLSDHRAGLGECPVWEPVTSRLRWIDAARGAVLATTLDGTTERLPLPEPPGCIVPAAGGGLVCAAGRDVFRLRPDGPGERLSTLPADDPGRCNDGKCDAAGRLWVGTALRTGDPACRLYRLDAFAFDGGEVGDRRTLLRLDPPLLPDGPGIDATGAIWLAVWGGAEVLRISPAGAVTCRLAVPAGFVTSCAFGGDDLAALFVTTATGGEEPDDQGGALFAFAPDVTGLPVAPFGP